MRLIHILCFLCALLFGAACSSQAPSTTSHAPSLPSSYPVSRWPVPWWAFRDAVDEDMRYHLGGHYAVVIDGWAHPVEEGASAAERKRLRDENRVLVIPDHTEGRGQ